jgi:hypothetical protein
MLTFDQFRPIEAQYALFTPGLQFSAAKIMSRLSSFFDGTPVVLPLGVEVPASIPRVTLSTADERQRVQISSVRMDFFLSSKDSEMINPEQGTSLAASVMNAYLEVTRATVGRLAFVLKRVADDPTSAPDLARHFCRDQWLSGPLNRPEDFELHAHKKYRLADSWNVNSWMRCKSARLAASNQPVVLIEQDLNTLSEEVESVEFVVADINRFFRRCIPEVQSILELYFPGEHHAPTSHQ